MSFTLLLAQVTAESTGEFEFGRMHDQTQFILGVIVLCALVVFTVFVYIKDSAELHWSIATLLAGLRLGAFAMLFWVWLQPQLRNVDEIKQNSRVVVMVDGSASMNNRDDLIGSVETGPTRMERVIRSLKEDQVVKKLQNNHDVAVLLFFDDELRKVIDLKRKDPYSPETESTESESNDEGEEGQKDPLDIDWTEKFTPQGAETRIGDALKRAINDFRAGILAGVVVYTDGQNNAGSEPSTAIEQAVEARVPVYPIGVGSTNQPINVRVDALNVPRQAFPGDEYQVVGYVMATGPDLAGKTVQAELVSRPISGSDEGAETREGVEDVVLKAEGEAQPVSFRLQAGEIGRRAIELRITPPEGDAITTDNSQRREIDIIQQKTRILLFAGGPHREYRLLRNQLYRESRQTNSDLQVHVHLQIAQPGISQEANKILPSFPTSAAELAEYDCIVAFDPDWTELTTEQIDLLERWVAEQGGGLVVIPGPVNTERWTQREQTEKIRRLYPVEFERRFALLDAGRFKSTRPKQVLLTPVGAQSNFLWIADDAASSLRVWRDFEGVFGYYSVRGAKSNANVYARAEVPGVVETKEMPVYMADHYYGVGRVFYLGSGEIWRIRSLEVGYFERFYKKLIRHVTAGRSQVGSRRGVLLIDRDEFFIGQPVVVKAQLRTPDQEPLEAPSVPVDVLTPENRTFRIGLKPSSVAGPGNYVGQFIARERGAYRIELLIPDGGADDKLTRAIQVSSPRLEEKNIVRNDPLLSEIAEKTKGQYVIGAENAEQVVDQLPPQTKTEVQLRKPEPLWDEWWTLGVIVGLLGLEWLIRRLVRLA